MSDDRREIRIDLLATARTRQGTTEAAKDIDRVGDSADKASKKTEEFGKTSTVSGDKVEALGTSSERAAKHVRTLDDSIGRVNQNLAFLHEEFARASTEADRLDISKGIRKAENELRRLTRSRNFLAGMLGDPEPAAKSFMQRLGGALNTGGASVASAAGGKVGLTIGGAIGAAASPVIISAIGSALSAGVGAGVLAGGIALVAKDPTVATAGSAVGKRFASGVQAEATQAFRGPVLQSLGILEQSGQRVTKNLGRAFDALADDVVPFTGSVTRGVEDISDAVADVAENSGPAVRGLGSSFELLAGGAADFLRIVSDGSPEAAANLTLVAGATADVVRFSGLAMDTWGKLANNEWVTGPLLPLLRKHYQGVAEAEAEAAAAADPVNSAFEALNDSAITATEGLDAMEESLRGVTDANRSLYGSEVDAAEAIAEATEKIKENGEGLSLNTERGRENRAVLATLADKLSANYDAYVKVNGAGAGAQKVMENNRTAFVRAAEKAGYSATKARELADALLGIPRKTTPIISVSTGTSTEKINALKERLRSIKDRTVYVRVAMVEGRRIKVEDQLERGRNREFGGPVKKGHAYVVGEKRAEVFVPDRDGRIVPSIEQYRRQGGNSLAGGGGGGGLQPYGRMVGELRLNVTGAESRFKAFIQELFRETNLGYE